MCARVYVNVYASVHAFMMCMHVHVYISIHMYVCVCVCICACAAGLCVVYFLPVYFSISSSIEALESHGYFVDSKIAMLSYGAYVVGADHFHEDKVGFTK